MTETLQVGDRVVRTEYDNTPAVPVGSIGTITGVSEMGGVLVKWDKSDQGVYNSASCLTKVQAPQFIHHEQEGDTPESIALEQTDRVFHTGDGFTLLPMDSVQRKTVPIASGVLDYFPAAIVEVACVSNVGSNQHHPGQPLHWERGKSVDHADALMRHLLERGTVDTDGMRHSAKVAWRALALLQEELEAEGAPTSRGSSCSR
jgi:hypothetical protein